jgi:hypothetical protein
MHHAGLITAVTLLSLGLFVGSLLSLPWFVARIPADYFKAEGDHPSAIRRPGLRILARVLKNAVGAVLLAAGFAMLFLPGQGLLTILVAILLLDLPGKRRLTRRVVARPRVLAALNALRRRAGRPPLLLD